MSKKRESERKQLKTLSRTTHKLLATLVETSIEYGKESMVFGRASKETADRHDAAVASMVRRLIYLETVRKRAAEATCPLNPGEYA